MIVYVDLIFVINIIFVFCLILCVDLLLKRNTSYKRVLVSSLVGELSMITLFIQFNNVILFLFKLVLCILMSITCFKFVSIKYTLNNIIYMYLVGIILGGFIYFLYNEFQIDMTYSIRYLLVLVISRVALLIYYKMSLKLKTFTNPVQCIKSPWSSIRIWSRLSSNRGQRD